MLTEVGIVQGLVRGVAKDESIVVVVVVKVNPAWKNLHHIVSIITLGSVRLKKTIKYEEADRNGVAKTEP